jgi:hypothetical protein
MPTSLLTTNDQRDNFIPMGLSRGKKISENGAEERREVEERVRMCAAAYEFMAKRLKNCKKGDLLQEIALLREKRDLPKPDRLVVRHKTAMICWFARNDPKQLRRTELRIHSAGSRHPDVSPQSPCVETLESETPSTAVDQISTPQRDGSDVNSTGDDEMADWFDLFDEEVI